MAYELSDINRRALMDPQGFVEECDDIYNYKVEMAADRIINNMSRSPIVLLSGPSGSGKTTTAHKIEEELRRRGVITHTVSMDNYFKTINLESTPKTPEGELDLESPLCLDMELLSEHFDMLSRGERIFVPKYEFSRQMRILEPSKSLRLGRDEIAIFEGIHALNGAIAPANSEVFKLYISASTGVSDEGELLFKGTWLRLSRRLVRDSLFRGSSALMTLGMWANVRRGEKLYISPFKHKADLMFDSALPYEVPVMKSRVKNLFESAPDGIERHDEIKSVLPALERFADIDSYHVLPNSLLREFIGGSVYGGR